MSRKKITLAGEKFNIGNDMDKFSLLSSIIFLTKEEKLDKVEQLLIEIRKMLKSKGKNNLRDETLEIPKYNKTYYLFEKAIRVNFDKDAKLFDYKDYLTNTDRTFSYVDIRKNYLVLKNDLIRLMEEINNEQCSEALIKATRKEKLLYYNFPVNILGNLEKDFYLPEDVISDILKINLIIIDELGEVIKVIENSKKYNYLILLEENDNYRPLYNKERIFTYKDSIIKNLLNKDDIKEKEGLDEIMKDINKQDKNISEYVSSLNLDEA